MSNTNEKTLREKYFANEIYKIGEIVEDVETSEQVKIIDRGSNYITVASKNGVVKKWLNSVKETITEEVSKLKETDSEFQVLESGQLKMFGYETRNFTKNLSEFTVFQFSEFDDLYSKHQIVKCLDLALQESNIDQAYDYFNKVENFYCKQEMVAPLIIEAMKTDIERKRIAEIIANVAGIQPVASNIETLKNAISALKDKYQTRKQWEVLWPFFKFAQNAGLTGIAQNLPFNISNTDESLTNQEEIILSTISENLNLVIESINQEKLNEYSGCAKSNDIILKAKLLSEETINSVLFTESTNQAKIDAVKLSHKDIYCNLAQLLIPLLK